jgi:hypothetical protein
MKLSKKIIGICLSLLTFTTNNAYSIEYSEKVLINEKFNNELNVWLISLGKKFNLDVKNGKLFLENKDLLPLVSTKLFDTVINQSQNFKIEAEIKKIYGLDNFSYELVWGFKDKNNFYSFGVSSNGYYRYGKYLNGIYIPIINWKKSYLINNNDKNKLSIKKEGNKILFFVNDNKIDQSNYEKFIGNRQGFMLQSNMKVEIDNFIISQINAKYTLKDLLLNLDSPIIEILEPNVIRGFDVVSKDELTKVKGIAKDNDGISEVLVNGVSANVNNIGEFETYIKLDRGQNKINVIAKDKLNKLSNTSFTMTYKKTEPNEPIHNNVKTERIGKDYAILFATDNYDYWGHLINPINDARSIKNELKDNYNFNVEFVENPTKFILKSKLREYAFKKYNPDDQLFIFIAGHGQFDSTYKEGYIVTKDSLVNDEIKDSYISHSELSTIVNNIGCKHIFLVMDVCFGGTFDQKIAQRGQMENEYKEITRTEFIQRKLKNKTRLYLTSGGKEYVSDGRPGQHSPFARKFLEALRNYGGSDSILTQYEINNYVDKLIPEPRYGEFGNNEPGSDFIFVAK